MKKTMLSIAATALVSMGLVACGQQPSLPTAPQPTNSSSSVQQGNTLDNIKKAGKIQIAMDDTFPPMEYHDNKNQLVGFDVDLAKAVAKKMGVEATFVPTAWDGILPGLDAGKFDVIVSSMNVTDERKQKVNFVEYLNLGQTVIVKPGNPLAIKSVEELKGKTVGVQLGTTSETAVKKIQGVKEIKTYNAYTDAFNDMALGRLDAIVAAEAVGRYYMTTKPDSFQVVGESFQALPVGIALRKSDNGLVQELNKDIQELKQDGTFAEISKKWFGKDMSHQ